MPIDALNGVTTNAMTNALTSVSGTSSDVAGTAGATSTDGSGFAASLGNAVADKSGYVRMPDIDLGEQMSTLIMAQRGYQANAAVVDRAKTTYEAALQIGRR